jgi:hypothetical protein
MSAGVFPPTSSRSTRPRTSYAHAGVRGLCGLHEGAVSQRIGPGISATAAGPAGSHRWFPGGRGPSPRGVRGIGPPGEKSRPSPGWRPDRPGANGAFACPGTPRSPRAHRALSRAHLLLSRAHLLLSRAHPASVPSPPPGRTLLHSPHSPHSHPLTLIRSPHSQSALRACVLVGRKRAFACGVPGALRGTWASPTRFDEVNDPCPGNVLI